MINSKFKELLSRLEQDQKNLDIRINNEGRRKKTRNKQQTVEPSAPKLEVVSKRSRSRSQSRQSRQSKRSKSRASSKSHKQRRRNKQANQTVVMQHPYDELSPMAGDIASPIATVIADLRQSVKDQQKSGTIEETGRSILKRNSSSSA